jgi:hypothetical protein
MLLDCSIDMSGKGRMVNDVAWGGGDVGELVGQFLESIRTTSHGDDVGSLAGQPSCGRLSDARAGPGDNGHAISKGLHEGTLPLGTMWGAAKWTPVKHRNRG